MSTRKSTHGREGSGPSAVATLPDVRLASTEGRYRIQVVAEKTGIPAATLRAWERRYGIPVPARTESSYRLYSDRDIALVQALNQHCAAGMAPAEAARLLRAVDDEPEAPAAPAPVGDAFHTAVTRILDAVVRFDPDSLDAEIANALTLGSASAIFERVVAPVQVEVGELWHSGQISVGHEHLATESLCCAVRTLHRLVQPVDAERSVLLACFADEDHVLPVYGVAFRFASWGYRTVVLGSRTPPAALAAARASMEPDLIGLSVTIAPPLEHAQKLLEQYAAACGDVPWTVGGRAAMVLGPNVEAVGGIPLAPGDLASMRQRLDQAVRKRGPK
jgi:DNA-binding transcriptional MerR regulator/methylmalonyl-CoA mutase cobalamin-binding subunit